MLENLLTIANDPATDSIAVALSAIRRHLGMEVAYISEFVDGRSIFREVDAPGLEALIKVGDSQSLHDVYCEHILAGRIPELMPDTAAHPLARSMPITAAVPIGAHMSVPIRQPDGTALGMFCCLSPHANPSLNDRDLQVMRVFADMAANQIVARVKDKKDGQDRHARIRSVIDAQAFTFVYQPIWDFRHDRPVGFEALCRFAPLPTRTPDLWFNEAAAAGCGIDLELAVLERALDALHTLPRDLFLSVNASPETILATGLAPLLANADPSRIVLEVTEHARVDYPALFRALAPLRAEGVRLAIDDAGAGYASLQHIVQLKPDVIKLDMALTRTIDTDPARRALAAALIFFAQETKCHIVAEGIETRAELATLTQLGVPRGQGYLLGRPIPLTEALALVQTPAYA